jgi:hypothetical protein
LRRHTVPVGIGCCSENNEKTCKVRSRTPFLERKTYQIQSNTVGDREHQGSTDIDTTPKPKPKPASLIQYTRSTDQILASDLAMLAVRTPYSVEPVRQEVDGDG